VLKPDAQLQLDSFLRTVGTASESLLMLDYDGTLAPFRKERDQAFPYPGVAPILREIIRSGRTRLVIVSGRDTGATVPLLGIHPNPEVWGLHGRQRLMPDGTIEMPVLDERLLTALSDADRWLGYQQVRHTAEAKAASLAVHWRGLDEREAEELRGRVLLGWKPIAQRAGLNLLEFDGGVEICARETDKGDAVRTLLREAGPASPAAYLGDDNTDENAFRAIQGRGLSVLVRPRWRNTAAQLWLKPPDELLRFLTRWLEVCQKKEAAGSEAAAAVNG
jgi:trehalose 6-phosphate phosphatase